MPPRTFRPLEDATRHMAKKKTTRKKTTKKQVATITHGEASRANIPTAEYRSVMRKEDQAPVRVAYERGGGGLEAEKEGRDRDLDPQLVWRGKDEQDESDLYVNAPPLFIQEKVHPKALIDDLVRRSRERESEDREDDQPGLFADIYKDFNGLTEDARTEFYEHEANWTNRMILGDSLQVMASLSEREGLRGKVQCIYLDPPYGIKFNSNFQWSTTSRDVKDGKAEHITREPEMVKAFRDTWRDGIHSYLGYLRDRLTVCRDLLSESGSIFVQIGDENVNRVKDLLDELFGHSNFCSLITFQKTAAVSSPEARTNVIGTLGDYILWYAKSINCVKYRQPYIRKGVGEGAGSSYRSVLLQTSEKRPIAKRELADPSQLPKGARVFQATSLQSPGYSDALSQPIEFQGRNYRSRSNSHWKTTLSGITRLVLANRIHPSGQNVRYLRFVDDFAVSSLGNIWTDVMGSPDMIYVVQTNSKVVERCLLMASDPGDLVLDPTCGSGTTAATAEHWGRRWITIDTSRVALALARSRVMGAKYPFYLLNDSEEGARKEAGLRDDDLPSDFETRSFGENVRQGFVYERVPHITLKSIANNTEIDTIWEEKQPAVEAALDALNGAIREHPPKIPLVVQTGGREGEAIEFGAPDGQTVTMPSGEEAPANGFMEWEVPREPETPWPNDAAKAHAKIRKAIDEDKSTSTKTITNALQTINQALSRNYTIKTLPERAADPWDEALHEPHSAFWVARIDRQRAIDASIDAKAEHEYLYDKPYADNKKVRVAGPFTVESVSPHRTLGVDADDELIDPAHPAGRPEDDRDFAEMILEHLRSAGVQQAHKEDKIEFTSLSPWPGHYIAAEGRFAEIDGNGEEEIGRASCRERV